MYSLQILLGTTIQDGGKKERSNENYIISNLVWSMRLNNLLFLDFIAKCSSYLEKKKFIYYVFTYYIGYNFRIETRSNRT